VLGIPEKIDPSATEGKAALTKTMQDLAAAVDSSGMCLFGNRVVEASGYAAMVSALTGWDMDEKEFLLAGERIWNLQKLFNLKAGLDKDDDTLPPRMLAEPLQEGDPKGQVWLRDALLPEYYAVRGWDAEGKPTKKKLGELGIR
jgi:aldehyde:ferredoxin oxidoreductase